MEYEFKDDVVYIYIPEPQYGEHIAKRQIVMTKEIFIACYNRWIKNEGRIDGE